MIIYGMYILKHHEANDRFKNNKTTGQWKVYNYNS